MYNDEPIQEDVNAYNILLLISAGILTSGIFWLIIYNCNRWLRARLQPVAPNRIINHRDAEPVIAQRLAV